MGKTLGLNDDYWHGLIPLLCYIVAAIILILLQTGDQGIKITWFSGTFLLLLTQALNEFIQYKKASKQGDDVLERWKKNSLRDWGIFFGGSFAGSLLYGVLLQIF